VFWHFAFLVSVNARSRAAHCFSPDGAGCRTLSNGTLGTA